MKTEHYVIVSVALLAFGLIWLASHWEGTMGFSAAWPASGSLFNFNVTNKGSSALIGVLLG